MNTFVSVVAAAAALFVASGALAQSTPAPGSAAGGAAPSGAPQSAVLVDSSSVVGSTVRSQGKDIGKVERLLLDARDGRVRAVVVTMGGTLGVGGKSVAIPWDHLKLAQEGSTIIVSIEQQPLDQAPSASPRPDPSSQGSGQPKPQ